MVKEQRRLKQQQERERRQRLVQEAQRRETARFLRETEAQEQLDKIAAEKKQQQREETERYMEELRIEADRAAGMVDYSAKGSWSRVKKRNQSTISPAARERERLNLVTATRLAIQSKRLYKGKDVSSAHDLFKAMDANLDGSIDKAEFIEAMRRLDILVTSEQINTLAAHQGLDEDGFYKRFFHDIQSEVVLPEYSHSAIAKETGKLREKKRGVDYEYLASLHSVHKVSPR